LRGKRGLGFDSFMEWNVYFPLHRRKVSEKSHECFSLRNTRWTLGQTASDAETASDECSVVRHNLFCTSERSILVDIVSSQAQSEHLMLGVSDAPALDPSSASSKVFKPY